MFAITEAALAKQSGEARVALALATWPHDENMLLASRVELEIGNRHFTATVVGRGVVCTSSGGMPDFLIQFSNVSEAEEFIETWRLVRSGGIEPAHHIDNPADDRRGPPGTLKG